MNGSVGDALERHTMLTSTRDGTNQLKRENVACPAREMYLWYLAYHQWIYFVGPQWLCCIYFDWNTRRVDDSQSWTKQEPRNRRWKCGVKIRARQKYVQKRKNYRARAGNRIPAPDIYHIHCKRCIQLSRPS